MNNTILIVDDSSANIRILADMLKDMYKIAIAISGIDALKVVKQQKIDLILLDVMMPQMDGFETCTHFKEDDATKNIPVIFVTALSGVEDEIKGLEVGAVDFVSKPFVPQVIKKRIETHLKLYEYYSQLDVLARYDGLTNIPNRREYDAVMAQEYKRAQRTGSPISILMMDIDYFKKYNDRYGHGMGDECLKSVAQALFKIVTRTGDMVARYGGEEFIMLLPYTDIEGATHIADEVLQSIRALKIPHEQSLVSDIVTLSIGIATIKSTISDDYHSLEKQSDEALYLAKESGRNRYCVYDE